jgi:hypothetical protein
MNEREFVEMVARMSMATIDDDAIDALIALAREITGVLPESEEEDRERARLFEKYGDERLR